MGKSSAYPRGGKPRYHQLPARSFRRCRWQRHRSLPFASQCAQLIGHREVPGNGRQYAVVMNLHPKEDEVAFIENRLLEKVCGYQVFAGQIHGLFLSILVGYFDDAFVIGFAVNVQNRFNDKVRGFKHPFLC